MTDLDFFGPHLDMAELDCVMCSRYQILLRVSRLYQIIFGGLPIANPLTTHSLDSPYQI